MAAHMLPFFVILIIWGCCTPAAYATMVITWAPTSAPTGSLAAGHWSVETTPLATAQVKMGSQPRSTVNVSIVYVSLGGWALEATGFVRAQGQLMWQGQRASNTACSTPWTPYSLPPGTGQEPHCAQTITFVVSLAVPATHLLLEFGVHSGTTGTSFGLGSLVVSPGEPQAQTSTWQTRPDHQCRHIVKGGGQQEFVPLRKIDARGWLLTLTGLMARMRLTGPPDAMFGIELTDTTVVIYHNTLKVRDIKVTNFLLPKTPRVFWLKIAHETLYFGTGDHVGRNVVTSFRALSLAQQNWDVAIASDSFRTEWTVCPAEDDEHYTFVPSTTSHVQFNLFRGPFAATANLLIPVQHVLRDARLRARVLSFGTWSPKHVLLFQVDGSTVFAASRPRADSCTGWTSFPEQTSLVCFQDVDFSFQYSMPPDEKLNFSIALHGSAGPTWGLANVTMFQGVVPDDSHKDVATDGCNGWTLCSTVSTAQGPVRGPLGARMQNISRVTHYDFPVRRVRLKTRLFSRRTQGSMYLAVNGRDVWSKRRFKTDDCSALDGAWSTYNQLFDGTILTGTCYVDVEFDVLLDPPAASLRLDFATDGAEAAATFAFGPTTVNVLAYAASNSGGASPFEVGFASDGWSRNTTTKWAGGIFYGTFSTGYVSKPLTLSVAVRQLRMRFRYWALDQWTPVSAANFLVNQQVHWSAFRAEQSCGATWHAHPDYVPGYEVHSKCFFDFEGVITLPVALSFMMLAFNNSEGHPFAVSDIFVQALPVVTPFRVNATALQTTFDNRNYLTNTTLAEEGFIYGPFYAGGGDLTLEVSTKFALPIMAVNLAFTFWALDHWTMEYGFQYGEAFVKLDNVVVWSQSRFAVNCEGWHEYMGTDFEMLTMGGPYCKLDINVTAAFSTPLLKPPTLVFGVRGWNAARWAVAKLEVSATLLDYTTSPDFRLTSNTTVTAVLLHSMQDGYNILPLPFNLPSTATLAGSQLSVVAIRSVNGVGQPEAFNAGVNAVLELSRSGNVSMVAVKHLVNPTSPKEMAFVLTVVDDQPYCLLRDRGFSLGGCSASTTLVVAFVAFEDCPASIFATTFGDMAAVSWTEPTLHPAYTTVDLSFAAITHAPGQFALGHYGIVYMVLASQNAWNAVKCTFDVFVGHGISEKTDEVGHQYHVFPDDAELIYDFVADSAGFSGSSSFVAPLTPDLVSYTSVAYRIVGAHTQFSLVLSQRFAATVRVSLQWCANGNEDDVDWVPASGFVALENPMLVNTMERAPKYRFSIDPATAVAANRQCIRLVAQSEQIMDDIQFDGIYMQLDHTVIRRRSLPLGDRLEYLPMQTSFVAMHFERLTDDIGDPGKIVALADEEPPRWSQCPEIVSATANAGALEAIATWNPPIATDNVAVAFVTQTRSSGEGFSLIGSPHLVTYKAVDTAGLEAICSFYVAVDFGFTAVNLSLTVLQEDITPVGTASSIGSIMAGDLLADYTSDLRLSLTTTGLTRITLTIQSPGERFALGFRENVYPTQLLIDLHWASENLTSDPLPASAFSQAYSSMEMLDNTRTATATEQLLFFASSPSSHVYVDENFASVRLAGRSAVFTETFNFESLAVHLNFPLGLPPGLQHSLRLINTSRVGFFYSGFVAPSMVSQIDFSQYNEFLNLLDLDPPVFIVCPGNIITTTDLGQPYAKVNFTEPLAIDNRRVNTVLKSHLPLDQFAITYPGNDPHTVVYQAFDNNGNDAICSFTITVVDEEAPVISCPPPQVFSTNPNQGSVSLLPSQVGPVSATDNGGEPSVTQHPTEYSVGVYELLLVATDAFNNTANCSLVFEVMDMESPVIAPCPSDLVLQGNTRGQAVGFWSDPQVSDNSGILNFTQTHAPGQMFGVGNTTVLYEAFDFAENYAMCSFVVEVLAASLLTTGSSSSNLPLYAGAGGGGGLVLLLLIILAVVFYRLKHLKPANFDDLMKQLEMVPGLVEPGSDGARRPPELRRHTTTILEDLGKGNFGFVSKAVFKEPGAPEYIVAVKVLKGSSAAARDELLREAAIMAQFDHPHICGLVGVVTRGDPLLMLMEYCEFGALNSYLMKHDLDEFTKLILAGDCAAGLEYLASRGFVHRDVAARNVLLNSMKRGKIADFGMSRDTEQTNYYTSRGGQLPVRWTAPEALEEQKFSPKTDVWAYGVLLHEIWTRAATPYAGWSNQKVWVAVLTNYRLPCPSGCPEEVHHRMLECWAKEPFYRPTFTQLREWFRLATGGDHRTKDEAIKMEESLKQHSKEINTAVQNDTRKPYELAGSAPKRKPVADPADHEYEMPVPLKVEQAPALYSANGNQYEVRAPPLLQNQNVDQLYAVGQAEYEAPAAGCQSVSAHGPALLYQTNDSEYEMPASLGQATVQPELYAVDENVDTMSIPQPVFNPPSSGTMVQGNKPSAGGLAAAQAARSATQDC